MSILVLGATGQLGQEFAQASRAYPGTDCMLWTRADFDITRSDHLAKIGALAPDVVINCIAYTAVDKAETAREEAMAVNATGVGDLARTCAAHDIQIVHFSSEYVYHNYLRRPLVETDVTRPKGIYAKSKLKGEQLLLAHHPHPLIFRISWLYSTFGHNFPKTILRLARERDELRVVNDQIGAPVYGRDVALAVLHIVHQQMGKAWQPIAGIYNYSNEGTTHWAEIAQHVVQKAGLSCRIQAIPSRLYPMAAPRPRYGKMNLTKFKQVFQLTIPHWRDSMDICLDQLLNES